MIYSFALAAESVLAGPSLLCAEACSSTRCECATNCTSGYFNVYSTADCSGIAKKKIVISDGNITFAPTGTTYAKILCSDSTVSECYAIELFVESTTTTTTPSNITATTTTTRTTTTTPALTTCIYECCVSEPGYRNRFCDQGSTCVNNVCVASMTDCPNECCVDDDNYNDKFCDDDANCVDGKCVTPGPSISYSLIGIIAAAIIIGVVAFYFLHSRATGQKNDVADAYEALKRKWKGRFRQSS